MGGFYLFPNFSNFLNKRRPDDGKLICSDEDLAMYLLQKAFVVTIPGSKFSKPNHLRIVYLRSFEMIESGFKQLAKALENLK